MLVAFNYPCNSYMQALQYKIYTLFITECMKMQYPDYDQQKLISSLNQKCCDVKLQLYIFNKLVDYWGGDQVMTIISKQLQLPKHQLTNLERTYKLKHFLRGLYPASKHCVGSQGRSNDTPALTR